MITSASQCVSALLPAGRAGINCLCRSKAGEAPPANSRAAHLTLIWASSCLEHAAFCFQSFAFPPGFTFYRIWYQWKVFVFWQNSPRVDPHWARAVSSLLFAPWRSDLEGCPELNPHQHLIPSGTFCSCPFGSGDQGHWSGLHPLRVVQLPVGLIIFHWIPSEERVIHFLLWEEGTQISIYPFPTFHVVWSP